MNPKQIVFRSGGGSQVRPTKLPGNDDGNVCSGTIVYTVTFTKFESCLFKGPAWLKGRILFLPCKIQSQLTPGNC